MKLINEKRVWLSFGIFIFVATAFSVIAETETPPLKKDKVAVVNGTVITQKDFDTEFNQIRKRIPQGRQAIPDAQMEQIKRELLENLINQELLYQQSQKEGIVVEEKIIEDYLSSLKKKFPNNEEFEKALENFNVSEAGLRLKVKVGYTIQKFIEIQFSEKLDISEKECKAFYDVHPELFNQPEKVKASHILIKLDPQSEDSQKAKAKEKIEKIQKRLQAGEDFSALAKEFSEGPSKTEGGELSYFSRGQMVKPFEDAAFSLKPGEVSDIILTEFGYHLIKVTDRVPEQTIKFEDVKDKIAQNLKHEKTQKELKLYINDLRKDAKIEKFL